MYDKMRRLYFQQYLKRDFSFMEKGITAEQDLLLCGKMEFDKKAEKFIMQSPKLVIGSDRMTLWDFFGRRKETFSLQNRNWVKVIVAVTALHFLFARIPSMFSKYFGDDVGSVSKFLGARNSNPQEDTIPYMKEVRTKRKEL